MKNLIYVGLFLLGFAPVAEASRLLEMPPILFHSIHGGRQDNVCISADMSAPAAAYTPSGVVQVHHVFQFAMRNVSSVPQTVRVILTPGSRVRSRYSGPMQPAPTQTGASLNITQETSVQLVLAPSSSNTVLFTVNCRTASCWIAGDVLDAGGGTVSTGVIAGAPSGGLPVNCLDAESAMQFKIAIAEPRGAVSATFTTSYHRALGLTDKAISTPPSFAINGGRPF